MCDFGEDVVQEVLAFDMFRMVDLLEAERGAEPDGFRPVQRTDGPPLRFVLVVAPFAEVVAHDGVSALLDGGDQHGIVVEERMRSFDDGGIVHEDQGVLFLELVDEDHVVVGLLLAEISRLEHDIEADRGCAPFGQVLGHIGVEVAFPGGVGAEFRE